MTKELGWSGKRRIGLWMMMPIFGLGCSAHDRIVMTEFEPNKNGIHRYKATADAVYPANDAAAEKTRITWLEQYLLNNGLCMQGYTIESRNAVLKNRAALGEMHDIFYEIRCKI